MTWEEYIEFFSSRDMFDDLNLTFHFANSRIVEPSFFTRLNYDFIKTMHSTFEKNKIALIVPRHSKFLLSFVLFKTFFEIKNKEIETESPFSNASIGQKFKLYDAVVEIYKILSNNGLEIDLQSSGKSPLKKGWPIERIPPFVKAQDNEALSGPTVFKRAIEKWKAEKFDENIIDVRKTKTYRKKTTIIVGPTNKYKNLFKNTTVNGTKLLDLLSVGYMDNKSEINPLEESAERFDILLVPDAYGANLVLESSDENYIDSIFFDISDNDCSEDYLSWTERIEEHENVMLVFCIQENHTFDLKYFIDSKYSLFQWKKNYITSQFIFDDNNPEALVLDTFKERKFYVELLDDSPLEEELKLIRSYENEISDADPCLINAYHQFFLEIISLCRNYCFNDVDFIESRKRVLDARLASFDNTYLKNVIGNHPLIEQLKTMKNKIIEFYSGSNKKTDYIASYLIENCEKKVCIVVPDNKNFNVEVIFKYYYNTLKTLDVKTNFVVLSTTSYKESDSEFDIAICVGWSAQSTMKEVLFSNNAFENIILLYRYELPWIEFSKKIWNNTSYKNDFSILDAQITPPEDEMFFEYDINGLNVIESDDNSVESLDEIKLKFNNTLVQSKKNSSPYGQNVFIEGALVCFSDETYGIFGRYKTFVCVNEVLKGNENKPTEKTTEDLVPGDIVLFKDRAINVINELAKKMLNDSGYENLDVVARSWKDAIQDLMLFEGISASDVIQRIKDAGSKRHYATIHRWIYSEEIICPIDKKDLICIANACGLYGVDLLNNIDDVFDAASVVRRAHIQAGFRVSDIILGTQIIKEAVESYTENGYFDFPYLEFDNDLIGHISIVKVTDMGEFQEYPKTICDIREEN